MPLAKNQTVRLSIESLSSDGNGVGRHEGQAVFVPYAAVGDVLDIRIVKAAKTHAFGRIHQVITPGPGRIWPECPAAGRCGGCSFCHITYEAELAAKQKIVADALLRIGHLDVPVQAILPSPAVARYRNKVQLPVTQEDGGLLYGFYANRSHRIVQCDDCLLQPTEMNEIAADTARLLQLAGAEGYDEAAHTGLVRHIYLRRGHYSGEVMVCIVATSGQLPDADWIVEQLRERYPCIATVVLNINRANTNVILGTESHALYGPGYIHDSLCGVPQRLHPLSFSQVNTLGAEQLFGVAKALAAPKKDDVLLDLYCGAGVIGLSMAREVKQLVGVEIVAPAIEAAKASATEIGLANTRFLCEDAGSAAKRLASEGLKPTVITVDPPRKGCDTPTIEAMLAMAPRRIVMVSCNPATMARDLAALCNGGYALQRVQPVDMFPRTRHVECVALLELC